MTPVGLPNTDELLDIITHFVIYPDLTCEELRTAFDVEYLPLAELPTDIGLEYEEHFVPTPDGETLHAWYLPTTLSRGIVVVVQGATGTMPCYLFVARLLAHKGWSVLMYDYRGFGESSGEPDIGALHVDLNAVLDWALDHTEWDKFTLLGISLGSLPAVSAAVGRPEIVAGLVLDSPVAMGLEIQRFTILLGSRTQAMIEMLPEELLPEESISRMNQPLLVFASGMDAITPQATVEVFYERASGPIELILFPNLGHATAPYHGTGSYSYYLERFLARIWDQEIPFTVEHAGVDGRDQAETPRSGG